MNTLSREQVRRLTPEQQALLGGLEAQRISARQQLIRSAHTSRGKSLVAGVLMGTACGLAIYGTVQPKALPFAVIVAVSLVGLHAAELTQRLDALLQLRESDLSLPGTEARQHNQNAAQPGAPPNGGPATPSGDSGVTEGPPSVS